MPSLRLASIAIAAFLSVSTGHAETASPTPRIAPNASTFTLDNGMQVVVIPDHRAPVVTHMVWYKAGSAEDPPGRSGIAHFLEHLMFKGTKNHPPGEFRNIIAGIGGNENAFTTYDYTAYHQTVAKEHLGLVMDYESDRMANLVIDDDAIATEREVIIEERRSRTDSEPAALLGEAMNAALFQNSHYGIPIIGWPDEMAKLSREDALAFYDRYYTPNNAVLVVAGDVTEEEVRKLAEESYGKVARRAEPPPRDRPQEPRPNAARTVTLADARVSQPSLRRFYLAPSYTTAKPGEAESLDVLAEILGGSATSRLYRSLVVEKGVAVSAGAGYRSDALDDGSFVVAGSPRGDLSLDDLEKSIDEVIASLLEDGITDEELASAKKRIIAGSVYAQDSQGTLARVFGQALTTGGTMADVQDWPAHIEAVTKDQVMAAARDYLAKERSVTGYLVTAAKQDERT